MRRILIVCLVLLSCNKSASLKNYSVAIYKYRISNYKFGKSPGTLEQDSVLFTIRAKNDTSAYIKGFKIWYKDFQKQMSISLKDSSTMRSRFIIKDRSGNDLEKKLSHKILDSIRTPFLKSLFKNIKLKHQ